MPKLSIAASHTLTKLIRRWESPVQPPDISQIITTAFIYPTASEVKILMELDDKTPTQN